MCAGQFARRALVYFGYKRAVPLTDLRPSGNRDKDFFANARGTVSHASKESHWSSYCSTALKGMKPFVFQSAGLCTCAFRTEFLAMK